MSLACRTPDWSSVRCRHLVDERRDLGDHLRQVGPAPVNADCHLVAVPRRVSDELQRPPHNTQPLSLGHAPAALEQNPLELGVDVLVVIAESAGQLLEYVAECPDRISVMAAQHMTMRYTKQRYRVGKFQLRPRVGLRNLN